MALATGGSLAAKVTEAPMAALPRNFLRITDLGGRVFQLTAVKWQTTGGAAQSRTCGSVWYDLRACRVAEKNSKKTCFGHYSQQRPIRSTRSAGGEAHGRPFMAIHVVLNQKKGGVGKSTIAVNLAAVTADVLNDDDPEASSPVAAVSVDPQARRCGGRPA